VTASEPSANQPINQPINQATHPPTNQPAAPAVAPIGTRPSLDLHRGGEILPLVKHPQRFTVRLDRLNPATIDTIITQILACGVRFCGEVAIGSQAVLKLLEFEQVGSPVSPPVVSPIGLQESGQPESQAELINHEQSGQVEQSGQPELAESALGENPEPSLTPAHDALAGDLAGNSPDLDSVMAQVRQIPGVVFVSHVYQAAESAGSWVYLADDLAVQFQPGIDPERRSSIAEAFGIEVLHAIDGLTDAFVYRLTPQATANPIKLCNALTTLPEVIEAEPNVIIQTTPHYCPTDSLYRRQWYLHNTGGSQVDPEAHIHVEAAWDITRGDRAIVVAVADDAIDIDHPDFQGIGKIVAPRDLADRDFIPQPAGEEDNHGTACAGVCVAEETGTGIIGIAPNCALMPIRTTGYLDDQSVEDVFNWAIDRGAAVISCSWGASAVYFPLSMRQRAVIQRAATKGRKGKGCVVVFAAGNANRPTQGTIDEQNWDKNVLSGPTQWLAGYATHPDVVVVSASTSLNRKAAYSNWGKHITVCAPSNNAPPGMWFPASGYLYTAPKLQTALPGLGVFTTDRLGAAGYSSSDFTDTFGGTSSACPVVAGVAALILSANPHLTAAEVKQILQTTADKIEDPNPDPQLGLRYGTYDREGHSLWFGYGKVNAAAAVKAAQQRQVQAKLNAIAISKRVRGMNDRAVNIPDYDLNGTTSAIRVLDPQGIQEISVTVAIEHSFLGDLSLTLIAPDQTRVLLQSRTLSTRTQLEKTYTLANTPALATLLGKSGEGIWTLRVVDAALGDLGTLKSWQLELGLSA